MGEKSTPTPEPKMAEQTPIPPEVQEAVRVLRKALDETGYAYEHPVREAIRSALLEDRCSVCWRPAPCHCWNDD